MIRRCALVVFQTFSIQTCCTAGGGGVSRRVSMCAGCRDQILDQYILRVAPDTEWHVACLKCTECGQQLDETCTCFVRDDKTFCKRDYLR